MSQFLYCICVFTVVPIWKIKFPWTKLWILKKDRSVINIVCLTSDQIISPLLVLPLLVLPLLVLPLPILGLGQGLDEADEAAGQEDVVGGPHLAVMGERWLFALCLYRARGEEGEGWGEVVWEGNYRTFGSAKLIQQHNLSTFYSVQSTVFFICIRIHIKIHNVS